MRGELKNTELRQKVLLQWSVLLSPRSVTAQRFSPHHQHHLQPSYLFNILYIKSKPNLLVGHPLWLLSRSLGCLKWFADFHFCCCWASLATAHADHHMTTMRTFWSKWIRAWYTPWSFKLFFSVFLPMLMQSSLPRLTTLEPFDLSWLDPGSPLFDRCSRSLASMPDYPRGIIWSEWTQSW